MTKIKIKRFSLLSFPSKQTGFTGKAASKGLFPTQILSSWGQTWNKTEHLSGPLKPGKGTPYFFWKAQVLREDVEHMQLWFALQVFFGRKGKNMTLNLQKKMTVNF